MTTMALINGSNVVVYWMGWSHDWSATFFGHVGRFDGSSIWVSGRTLMTPLFSPSIQFFSRAHYITSLEAPLVHHPIPMFKQPMLWPIMISKTLVVAISCFILHGRVTFTQAPFSPLLPLISLSKYSMNNSSSSNKKCWLGYKRCFFFVTTIVGCLGVCVYINTLTLTKPWPHSSTCQAIHPHFQPYDHLGA